MSADRCMLRRTLYFLGASESSNILVSRLPGSETVVPRFPFLQFGEPRDTISYRDRIESFAAIHATRGINMTTAATADFDFVSVPSDGSSSSPLRPRSRSRSRPRSTFVPPRRTGMGMKVLHPSSSSLGFVLLAVVVLVSGCVKGVVAHEHHDDEEIDPSVVRVLSFTLALK